MNDDGQALVELALVLPLLLAATFAIVLLTEVGIGRLTLEQAAAEGARAGALTNSDAAIRESVTAAAAPLDGRRISIEIDPPEDDPVRTGAARGALVTVRLGYAVALPFAGLPPVIVRGEGTRRIEWSR